MYNLTLLNTPKVIIGKNHRQVKPCFVESLNILLHNLEYIVSIFNFGQNVRSYGTISLEISELCKGSHCCISSESCR